MSRPLYYDLECYPDYFMVATRVDSVDTIYRLGDHEAFAAALATPGLTWVGFNVVSYDDVMLAWWLSQGPSATAESMKRMNDFLIAKEGDLECELWLRESYSTISYQKFGEERVVRYLRRDSEAARLLCPERKVVDLYLLGEKQGSLKNAAIVLDHDSLVETPFSFDEHVAGREAEVDRYCLNDLAVTKRVHEHYADLIAVREQFETHGIHNPCGLGSAKLAEVYLLTQHERASGIRLTKDDRPEYPLTDEVSLLTRRYDYAFACPTFQRFWGMLKRAHIHYQPHHLTDTIELEEDADDGVLSPAEAKKPSIFSLGSSAIPKGALVVSGCGLKLKFGGGGLHNEARSGLWRADDAHAMWDIDVTSFYPSLIIANDFCPRHFPEMGRLMRELFAERVAAKRRGDSVEADSKKLVLNSSFGKTKDAHSALYDPRAHYSVTLNGQLLLMTLIDMIHESMPESVILNVNTDGLCVRFPREKEDLMLRIMRAWEGFSGCSLEHAPYEIFAQAACNLYCGRFESGKIKSKGGDFKLAPSSLKEVFAKSRAVKKAVVAHLLDGTEPAETIAAATPAELCMSLSFGKKTHAMIDGRRVDRKAVRYAYAKTGVTLGRATSAQLEEGKTGSTLDSGRPVVVVDELSTMDLSLIDYDRYAAQAHLIIMRMLRPAVRGTGAALARDPSRFWHERDWRSEETAA